jgi:hypothetical protein
MVLDTEKPDPQDGGANDVGHSSQCGIIKLLSSCGTGTST